MAGITIFITIEKTASIKISVNGKINKMLMNGYLAISFCIYFIIQSFYQEPSKIVPRVNPGQKGILSASFLLLLYRVLHYLRQAQYLLPGSYLLFFLQYTSEETESLLFPEFPVLITGPARF